MSALYPFLAITPLSVFLVLFLAKFLKTRQRMFLRLSFLFISTILNQACLILMVISSSRVVAERLFVGAQVLEVTSMLVMVTVLEVFEENQPFSPRVAGFTAIASMIVGTLISGPKLDAIEITTPIGAGYLVHFIRPDVAGFFMGIFPVLVGIWVIKSFFTKRKLTRSKDQGRLLFLLYLGIFVSQCAGTFAPVAIETAGSITLKDIAWNIGILRVVGIGIIGIAFYQVAKKPWLLQLQRIHLLLVYAKNGITLFSQRFRADISDDDVQLLAGAITAMASLFRESTKETSPIEAIQFKGKAVRIIDRGDFTCAIMVDYASQASDSAHKLFVQEFEAVFAAEIAGFTGEVSKFEKAEAITAKYFA
ncbi:MAG: hypothetical protein Q6370_002425 [Candidatus Sigynarchaeota archaeon]